MGAASRGVIKRFYEKIAAPKAAVNRQLREQLVASESMAALGRMVAGMTHEINTPLGNALTAASVLNAGVRRLKRLVQRSEEGPLDEVVASLEEAAELVLQNCHRAVEQIRDFKTMSADQSSGAERTVELQGYVQGLFSTFKMALTARHIRYRVTASELRECRWYPGIFAQIISNLIQNSLLHAFEGEKRGEIYVQIDYLSEGVRLSYEDNGHGVDPAIAAHLFEPFITTRRDNGGSGLGLYIVHTLVTQALQGSIKVESEKGVFTRFVLEFPYHTGQHKERE